MNCPPTPVCPRPFCLHAWRFRQRMQPQTCLSGPFRFQPAFCQPAQGRPLRPSSGLPTSLSILCPTMSQDMLGKGRLCDRRNAQPQGGMGLMFL